MKHRTAFSYVGPLIDDNDGKERVYVPERLCCSLDLILKKGIWI